MQYVDGGFVGNRRGMVEGTHAQTASFHVDEARVFFVDIQVEQADGVRATVDTGDDDVRLSADGSLHLRLDLVTDNALEIAHRFRVRRGVGGGAGDVECVVHAGNLFAHGSVHRVFQRTVAVVDTGHARTQ